MITTGYLIWNANGPEAGMVSEVSSGVFLKRMGNFNLRSRKKDLKKIFAMENTGRQQVGQD
jgi:hypothetical protein